MEIKKRIRTRNLPRFEIWDRSQSNLEREKNSVEFGTGMKQISVIGKEVENKNEKQPCKLLVTSFDTNDLDLQPPPPFPEKRPKSTTVTQRPTSFLENIKVIFNFVLS